MTDMVDLTKLQLEFYDIVNVKVLEFRMIFVTSLAESMLGWRRYCYFSERKNC